MRLALPKFNKTKQAGPTVGGVGQRWSALNLRNRAILFGAVLILVGAGISLVVLLTRSPDSSKKTKPAYTAAPDKYLSHHQSEIEASDKSDEEKVVSLTLLTLVLGRDFMYTAQLDELAKIKQQYPVASTIPIFLITSFYANYNSGNNEAAKVVAKDIKSLENQGKDFSEWISADQKGVIDELAK